MPVNYSVPILTTRLQVVANAIDAGGGNGFMRLLGSAGIVSSLQLARPCAIVAGGTLTFSGLSLIDPAAIGGTATAARCEDSAGNVIISGLVVNNPSGVSDIVLTPTNVIAAGQTVAITTATITGN